MVTIKSLVSRPSPEAHFSDLGKNPSIHPSIYSHLSGFGLWGQQPMKRSQDLPLPGYLLQLFWKNAKSFSDQPRGIIYLE